MQKLIKNHLIINATLQFNMLILERIWGGYDKSHSYIISHCVETATYSKYRSIPTLQQDYLKNVQNYADIHS